MKGDQDAKQTRKTGVVACRSPEAISHPNQSGCRGYKQFSAPTSFLQQNGLSQEAVSPLSLEDSSSVKQ